MSAPAAVALHDCRSSRTGQAISEGLQLTCQMKSYSSVSDWIAECGRRLCVCVECALRFAGSSVYLWLGKSKNPSAHV